MTLEIATQKARLENQIDKEERIIKSEKARQHGIQARMNTSISLQNNAINRRAKLLMELRALQTAELVNQK